MFVGGLSMRAVNARMQDAVNVQGSMARFMAINQKPRACAFIDAWMIAGQSRG